MLYLVAVLPAALVAGARSVPGVALSAVHLGALVLLGTLAARGRDRSWLGLWLPLLMIPLLYWEIPLLNQVLSRGYHDALVVGWEHALFGGEPARHLAGRLPWLWVSEALHLAYLSLYPLVFIPPFVLFVRHDKEAFHVTVLGLMVAALSCYVVFVYFPVEGPRYLGPPPGVPDGPMRRLALAILVHGSSRGAAFPSAHVALMTAQSILGLRFQRRLGMLVSLATVGVALGAVYGGFHYGVDVLAGGGAGGLAAWGVLRAWEADASASARRSTAASDIAG